MSFKGPRFSPTLPGGAIAIDPFQVVYTSCLKSQQTVDLWTWHFSNISWVDITAYINKKQNSTWSLQKWICFHQLSPTLGKKWLSSCYKKPPSKTPKGSSHLTLWCHGSQGLWKATFQQGLTSWQGAAHVDSFFWGGPTNNHFPYVSGWFTQKKTVPAKVSCPTNLTQILTQILQKSLNFQPKLNDVV